MDLRNSIEPTFQHSKSAVPKLNRKLRRSSK